VQERVAQSPAALVRDAPAITDLIQARAADPELAGQLRRAVSLHHELQIFAHRQRLL
jgi:predicted component of type VI protein secretion system